MASKDSFFIRVTKDLGNTNTFHEKSVDLGAYVDAMNETVLRIHNIAATFSDNTGRSTLILAAGDSAAAQWQLTTQSQTDIVLAEDKSLISNGRVIANAIGVTGPGVAPFLPADVSQDFDVSPQHWTNGYLIGTEQIYLGGAASTGWAGDQYLSLVLECTVEKLTKGAAMALALSQQ
jgi:hypothetical protein